MGAVKQPLSRAEAAAAWSRRADRARRKADAPDAPLWAVRAAVWAAIGKLEADRAAQAAEEKEGKHV